MSMDDFYQAVLDINRTAVEHSIAQGIRLNDPEALLSPKGALFRAWFYQDSFMLDHWGTPGKFALAQYLVEQGLDIAQIESLNGPMVNRFLCEEEEAWKSWDILPDIASAYAVWKLGASLHYPCPDSTTPLRKLAHVAFYIGHNGNHYDSDSIAYYHTDRKQAFEMIQYVLDHECMPNILTKDATGSNILFDYPQAEYFIDHALHGMPIQCTFENVESTQQIVNTTNYLGITPLHQATLNGRLSAVWKLLQLGADPNSLSIDHHTPLHVAAYMQNGQAIGDYFSIYQVLLAYGAKEDVQNKLGKTPTDILHQAEAYKIQFYTYLRHYIHIADFTEWGHVEDPGHYYNTRFFYRFNFPDSQVPVLSTNSSDVIYQITGERGVVSCGENLHNWAWEIPKTIKESSQPPSSTLTYYCLNISQISDETLPLMDFLYARPELLA